MGDRIVVLLCAEFFAKINLEGTILPSSGIDHVAFVLVSEIKVTANFDHILEFFNGHKSHIPPIVRARQGRVACLDNFNISLDFMQSKSPPKKKKKSLLGRQWRPGAGTLKSGDLERNKSAESARCTNEGKEMRSAKIIFKLL